MEPTFDPVHGADGWQISNLPVLSLAPYLASVEMFDEIGMDALIEKRDLITAYLEFVLQEIDKEVDSTFEIITPSNSAERASQLSVLLHGEGRSLFDYLMKNGIAKTRIRVEGKGSYENIGNIAHPKGYNLNNRIEYIYTPQPTN